MKASEAKQIADNCYKEEVNYYFENILSPERAIEDVILSAEQGYYELDIGFFGRNEFQKNISDRAIELIMEKFTAFFVELGYNVKDGTRVKPGFRPDATSVDSKEFGLIIRFSHPNA
jgi:hypothetical protein